MASKKARLSSPVRSRTASARAGEVSGPVATMTLSQSSGGNPETSSRTMVTSGWRASVSDTAPENASRSTARAPPAGTLWASAQRRIRLSQRRISSCSRPTALYSASSERNEFEHTISASPSVWCASVWRTGRISCRTDGTPAEAICQAASLPARPPPMTWMGRGVVLMGYACLRKSDRADGPFSGERQGAIGTAPIKDRLRIGPLRYHSASPSRVQVRCLQDRRSHMVKRLATAILAVVLLSAAGWYGWQLGPWADTATREYGVTIEFSSLERKPSPNQYLIAPDGATPRAKPNAGSPVFAV